jgi:hypothetical protein
VFSAGGRRVDALPGLGTPAFYMQHERKPAPESTGGAVVAPRRVPSKVAWNRHWVAIIVIIILSVVHTWPLATNPASLSLNDNGDTMLNEWILAWVVHQLPRDPLHLFDGNIFHPAKDTLAFSEPLIVPAMMAAPILSLGGSPVLAYNLLLLAGFALTALATYAVAVTWTGDRLSALVAGSAFAFSTHTLTRMPHLQAIHAYGLPLVLLFTDSLIREPRVRTALGLAAVMSVMVYTSGYLVVFGTLAIAVALLVRWREWRRRLNVLAAFVLAAVTTAVVALPAAIPYRRVAIEQGMVRSVDNIRQFSATPTGYLAASGRLHFSTWAARFSRNPVDTFFPGFVAFLLAGFAVWRAVRTGTHSSLVLMLSCIALTGFVLSLGVSTPVYWWLYAIFPPMQGLRAAARFGNLFLLAIALLAALGLAMFRQSGSWRRFSLPAAIAAVAIVNVESLRAPFEYRRFDGIPSIYRLIQMEPGAVVLAETPFYPAHAAFENAEYVLNSTAHWRPLLNGYSGYTPASYRSLAWILWYFPRDHAIKAMRDAGVTHFTVHPRRYGSKANETLEVLSRREDIELVAVTPALGPRLYRFR